jgi:hypothetical protein
MNEDQPLNTEECGFTKLFCCQYVIKSNRVGNLDSIINECISQALVETSV